MASSTLPNQPVRFTIDRTSTFSDNQARLGTVAFNGRLSMSTPHYLAPTSRGSVPHLTPDMMLDHTAIRGVYAGFEDYAEQLPRLPPASFPCPPSASPLRLFTALPPSVSLILGPRRVPAIQTPASNTPTSLSIATAVGNRKVEVRDYIEAAVGRLRPDAVIAPCDVELGRDDWKPGRTRLEKMDERTSTWLKAFIAQIDGVRGTEQAQPAAWVPMLPIEEDMQRSYLDHLEDRPPGTFNGVVVYDVDSLTAIPAPLQALPRMTLTSIKSPHQLLRAISLGADLLVVPFVTVASESGVALDFVFPPPVPFDPASNKMLPLGVDLFPKSYATDLRPIDESCRCYTCTKHHRAYLRHLLDAKEMTAWVLLQVHNFAVMDRFSASVRASLERGTFEQDAEVFEQAYEPELPHGTAEKPRIRGYQHAQTGPAPLKLNKAPFRKLESHDGKKERVERALDERKEKISESKEAKLMTPSADAKDLEDLGFAELYGEK